MLAKRNNKERTKMPYYERIRHYEFEKKSVLEMWSSPSEVDRALYLLRRKWGL